MRSLERSAPIVNIKFCTGERSQVFVDIGKGKHRSYWSIQGNSWVDTWQWGGKRGGCRTDSKISEEIKRIKGKNVLLMFLMLHYIFCDILLSFYALVLWFLEILSKQNEEHNIENRWLNKTDLIKIMCLGFEANIRNYQCDSGTKKVLCSKSLFYWWALWSFC